MNFDFANPRQMNNDLDEKASYFSPYRINQGVVNDETPIQFVYDRCPAVSFA